MDISVTEIPVSEKKGDSVMWPEYVPWPVCADSDKSQEWGSDSSFTDAKNTNRWEVPKRFAVCLNKTEHFSQPSDVQPF